jgi:NADH-ubiquinone oxidoreductase chain 6
MTTLFINLLAFGTLLSSVFSITSKNPVISVIFLITTFVQAAGYLILIGINFIGISYVVIYVGAIAVLFLFVIMMINIKLTDILETGTQYTKNLPLAIAIVSLNSILSNSNAVSINLINSIVNNYFVTSLSDVIITDFQQIEVLGHGLYTYGAVLLITLSVILLLAMYATIVISKSKKTE